MRRGSTVVKFGVFPLFLINESKLIEVATFGVSLLS